MTIYHYAVRAETFWCTKNGKDVFKEIISDFKADRRAAVLSAHEKLRDAKHYRKVELLRREISPWEVFSVDEGFPDSGEIKN